MPGSLLLSPTKSSSLHSPTVEDIVGEISQDGTGGSPTRKRLLDTIDVVGTVTTPSVSDFCEVNYVLCLYFV